MNDKNSLRVLIVEDSEDDAWLVLRELRRSGYEPDSERVESAGTMRAALSSHTWDVILSDYMIPGFGGLEALRIAKESGFDLPFILLSNKVSEETLVEAMRAGATDFLMKDRLERLGPVVKRELTDAAARRGLKRVQEALAKSERHFRSLIEHASDLLAVADVNGTITYISPSVRQIGGYEIAEVLGKNYIGLIHPEDAPAAAAGYAEIIRDPSVLHKTEFRFRKKDGTWTVLESVARNALADPLINGIVINSRDVTERKRAQEELRQLNWALRALGQSNSALIHAGTEKELFQSCCDAIAGTEGYPLVWIAFARDDAAHSIEITAAAGEASKYQEGLEVSWADAPLGRGPTGTSIRTGATQVTNNLATSAAYLPWIERARAHGLASSISLPIRANGAVMAALAIYSRELGAFGQPEVELFEELAADIGYGIVSRRTRLAYEAGLVEREQGTRKLRAAFESLIAVLAATVERRDPYTAGHQRRVAELASAIGYALGLDPARIEGLHFAATIHDIGKIYVPAEILARPGKLGATEFELVKAHAEVGFEILKDVDFPWQVADMVRQHHERLDGSGYPQGLKGDQILFESRILAVADVVEAMSSHRPYRAGLGLDAALAQVRQEAGTKLDLQVVDACERVFREQGFAFGAGHDRPPVGPRAGLPQTHD